MTIVERVFENDKYFGKSDLYEEQLKKCKMPKNDYHVSHLSKFQDHYLTPSKSKKAILPFQVNLQGKERFYNALFIEAFVKQETKSFYYDKKTKQSFYKGNDKWEICDNDILEKIVKRLEDRLTKVGIWGANMLKTGYIPPARYGYDKIDYDLIERVPQSALPQNEKELLEQLSQEYIYGLFESCDNERKTDILIKDLKKIYDPKASHNSTVNVKYIKQTELCEADASKSDDEEEYFFL